MQTRLTIHLSEPERQALQVIAETELRDPREQARFLLRRELIRLGLLPAGPDGLEPKAVAEASM